MLIDELEAVGIRLNAKKPDVVFKQKMAGGVRSLERFAAHARSPLHVPSS